MEKKKIKLTFIASAVTLIVCLAMLAGTTFAWFTDSAKSKNNVIQAGTLDVELYYQKAGETSWTKVKSNTSIFVEDASWEPGHTEIIRLKIVNEGNLALKYRLGVNVPEETGSKNSNGDNFKLSDFIKYGAIDGMEDYTGSEAVAAVDPTSKKLNESHTSAMVTLLPETETNSDNEDIITLVVYMPESIGNEANHAVGELVPRINLGINLVAIQESFESDSFDEKYDEGLDPLSNTN